ncbi:MAG: hypothetical protein ACXVGA_00945 [Mycobacteriaceae bacterium]
MAIAYDSSGTATAGGTTVTFDISSASVGSVVYAWAGFATAQTSITAPTGWTQLLQGSVGISGYALIYKVKASGDTTFTLTGSNSAKITVGWVSYLGLDTVNGPHETVTSSNFLALSSSTTSYPSPSLTPATADRWALYGAYTKSNTSANKNISYTPDGALTERLDANNTVAFPNGNWVGVELADSNAAVTAAAHSYTATEAFAENLGGAFLIYLKPSSGNVTALTTMISSSEAFGTPTMVAGALTASPSGIATSETFGNPSLLGPTTLGPTGIASGETFGATTATMGAPVAQPYGPPSGETFGTPAALYAGTFAPTGISSGEAFGTPTVTPTTPGSTYGPTFISSGELFGFPTVTANVTVTAVGIDSGEAFGPVAFVKHYKTFIPPTYEQAFGPDPSSMARANGDRLFSRLTYPVGYAVLKTNGFYTLVRNPDAESIASADVAYLGGHTYLVSDQEAADLTAAGYTVSFQ